MHQEELKIHGSVFLLLKKFIESNYDVETWVNFSKAAGVSRSQYEMNRNYPASEFFSIIKAAAENKGVPETELKEKLGEYLVPFLLTLYESHIDPTWKTFQMLEYTEKVMHKAVRSEASNANPPVLNVTALGNKLIIIDYYSKRKLGSLAIGIIRGIANHYNESERVHIIPKSNPDDERVQIRVEFDDVV